MDEREKLIEEILEKFNANIEEKTKSFLKEDDVEKIKTTFEVSIKEFNEEGLTKFQETIDKLDQEVIDLKEFNTEIRDIAKEQAKEIDALKAQPVADVRRKLSKEQQLEVLVSQAFNSKEFKDFAGGGYKGHSQKMCLHNDEEGKIQLIIADTAHEAEKAVVPITSHTGSVMISEISDIVRDDTPARKKHVRDLLTVSETKAAQIVAGQVTGWTDAITLGAAVLAENTAASEAVFTSKENTWSLKRIANSMRLSKRWLKVNGLQWVIDHVLAKLPDATYTVEDFQLLFGDGAGNNVFGLADVARAFTLISGTYSAGDIDAVTTYNGGTQVKIEFAAAHGIKNGDTLTIANATEATYNAAHTAVQVFDATHVIIDLTYVAEADTDAWTGGAKSIFSLAIEGAQEYDVLSVVRALLVSGEFGVTGHVVNPQQQIQMGLLKATDANYLNIQKDVNGDVVGVGGVPLAATTAMPVGKFLSGDFSKNGVELKEFTPFNIQFVEDVDSVKSNEIVVVVEEEIIFPVYNPYWFIYGKFATAKALLETA